MKENKGRIEVAQKAIKTTIKVSDLFKEYRRFKDEVWRGEGEWMIPCPFHNDLSPSLGINDKTGQWNCFGCVAHGDAVSALRWLARTVDHISYTYAESIDQLINRNPLLRESLPFDSVFDRTVSLTEVIQRPALKYGKVLSKTIYDVCQFLGENKKSSFIDIAYATSMMLSKQEPDQILSFFGAGQYTAPAPNTVIEKAEITAADLLAELDDWGGM